MTDKTYNPTLDSIRGVDLAYREALAHAEAIRENRNRMIRDALAAGHVRPVDVAKATGLTRGRIAQLTK